ncbi:hypothetical protein [Streptomyces cyanogenus]|uniref:NACHT N-terminal Helical domain-containing protein n=1 Tax=Streptomyces cyanogenus TaxID=80860 RepID=A0ABX7TRL1_STRCY|nr:hypothetical protein [Streptomyces cyanogenus]QTD98131.1 hypothetical protein S1361_12290 [Streptomyces cyanogenus]
MTNGSCEQKGPWGTGDHRHPVGTPALRVRLLPGGEKRRLTAPDLRGLAARLVEQALRTGAPAIPDDEREAVTEALLLTLHALGDLTFTDLDAVRLGQGTSTSRRSRLCPGCGSSVSRPIGRVRVRGAAEPPPSTVLLYTRPPDLRAGTPVTPPPS